MLLFLKDTALTDKAYTYGDIIENKVLTRKDRTCLHQFHPNNVVSGTREALEVVKALLVKPKSKPKSKPNKKKAGNK